MKKYMSLYDLLVDVGRLEHPPIEREEKKKGRKARGKANAFVERMAHLKDAVCLFFCSFAVPFDNNQAERDLRHAKVKLKVSGCFRTEEGFELFAQMNSFLNTAKNVVTLLYRHWRPSFKTRLCLFLLGATDQLQMLQKINQLIKDIERNGAAKGIGKPERLKGRPVWSRRIDHEPRLTYDVQENILYLISCKGHYED